ncbi:Sulfite exporter TauE/SafE [Citrobacter braakii]|uniref:sulfite exporter TauE/SafE family protein n=1 Tax=Enterobacteriaceae TaxID=543 RepID=UPI000DFFBD9D|nr:sulfite exporter TauE/SafE family protein [Citrobacter braakii]STH93730.1 Sulfite exporter TauE/SafE [Citrobacter braakii]
MVISLLSGLLVGAVLGITGAGGGIFAIPTLVMGMGWAPQQAAPVALVAVAGSAALGTFEAWRKGLVRYRAAIVIILAGVPMTSVGLWVAHRTSPALLSLLFAGVMLIVAWRLVRAPEIVARHTYPVELDEHTGRFIWAVNTWLLFLMFGAVTCFMTGLLAVGGGFIIVPLLRQFTPLPIHSCIATSLMIVALVSIGGIAVAVIQGATLPLPFTLWFVLSAATGMSIGRRLSQHLPEHIVQKGLSGLLIVVALGMVFNAVMMKFSG